MIRVLAATSGLAMPGLSMYSVDRPGTAPGKEDIMNGLLDSTLTDLHEHPPAVSYRPRAIGTIDRLALHMGIALIKWGRRPRAALTREQLELRHHARAEQELRERAAERRMLLMRPLR